MSFDEKTLLKQLDTLYEQEKYSEIEKEIKNLPRENISLELRFRLVSALSSQKKLNESIEELKEIEPLCKTPPEQARFWYSTGYVHYVNDCEMAASHCFKKALSLDPEDACELDLKAIIEECDGFISRDLTELKGLCRAAVEALRARFSEIASKNKEELSELEFTMYLGYLPAIRTPVGVKKPVLLDDPMKKYSEEEKPAVRDFLKNYFSVTDTDSFKRLYFEDRKYNLYSVADDVMSYLLGKPNFPVSELDGTGKEFFDDCVEYMNAIKECLPKSTVLAWDISEKIGIARYSYSCDIISDRDYIGCMKALTDAATDKFSSFEEYALSLVMGCGFFMFVNDNCSIKSAKNFINMNLPMILSSPLGNLKWGY